MLVPLLALALAAAPGIPASTPLKLAAPMLSGPNLSDKEAEFYVEHLAQQLAGRGLQVTTAKQIRTLLGLERQRALAGCGDNASSCIEELANALGVDGILTGEIGRFEGAFQVNLKVLSPLNGRTLVAYSARVESEQGLLDELTYAARKMATALADQFRRTLPPPTALVLEAEVSAERPARRSAWVPAAIGVVALGAGTVFYLQANQRYTTLKTSTAPIGAEDARALRNDGSLYQTVSLVGVGVGVAALATAGTMFFFRRDSAEQAQPPPQVGATLLPGGAAIAITGVLP